MIIVVIEADWELPNLIEVRDELRARLGEAYDALRIVDERIEHLQNEQRDQIELRRRLLVGGRPDMNALLTAQRYEVTLIAQEKTLAGQRQQLVDEVEKRRLALVEADRELKSLEKLDAKQRKAFQDRQLAAEAKALDEVAQIQRHNPLYEA